MHCRNWRVAVEKGLMRIAELFHQTMHVQRTYTMPATYECKRLTTTRSFDCWGIHNLGKKKKELWNELGAFIKKDCPRNFILSSHFAPKITTGKYSMLMYARQWPPLENEKCPNFLELAWEAAGDDWSAFTATAGLQTCPAAPRTVERWPVLAQQMWPRLCVASDVLQEKARPCRQTHRHSSAQPLSPSPLLSPLCAANRSCCPQDCASLHSDPWHTELSQNIKQFLFFPTAHLHTLEQQRWCQKLNWGWKAQEKAWAAPPSWTPPCW